MKRDLILVAIAGVAGFLASYFVTNLLYHGIDTFSFKKLDAEVGTSVDAPNPEVFNFRSVNPTVEVYVGKCTEYDENGECVVVEETTEKEDVVGCLEFDENGVCLDEEVVNGETN